MLLLFQICGWVQQVDVTGEHLQTLYSEYSNSSTAARADAKHPAAHDLGQTMQIRAQAAWHSPCLFYDLYVQRSRRGKGLEGAF